MHGTAARIIVIAVANKTANKCRLRKEMGRAYINSLLSLACLGQRTSSHWPRHSLFRGDKQDP